MSRGTIVEAFDRLRADGLIASRRGSGTFVLAPKPLTIARRDRLTPGDLGVSARALRISAISEASLNTDRTGAFRRNIPDLEAFPKEVWLKLLRRASRRSTLPPVDDSEAEGSFDLRAQIAHRLMFSRGIRAKPDEVIITDGVQHALDLLSQVLIEPGDVVHVEDPGYVGARSAFMAAGATIVSTPVDARGFDVSWARGQRTTPKAVYVTASAQTAYGSTMPLERRRELLAWASAHHAWIIADDSQGEFRYGGADLPTLGALDHRARTITVGTFATSMFPSIGIGYMVVPASLASLMAAVLRVASRREPSIEQAALAAFIKSHAFARHVSRMRALYSERRAMVLRAGRAILGSAARIIAPNAGLHAFVGLDASVRDVDVQEAALDRGVAVTAVSPYCTQHPVNGILLGFANVDVGAIPEALSVVRGCIDQAATAKLASKSLVAGA